MRKLFFSAMLVLGAANAAIAQEMDQERKPMSLAAPVPVEAPAYSYMPRARDGEIIDSEGSGAIPALPLQIMEQGGTRFVTGGIGDEELAQLKSVEQEYNLQLLLSGDKGAYISEAAVRVTNASGAPVLEVINAGPYFYARLAAGSYMLEVTSMQGVTQRATVTVPVSGTAKPVMRFKM